MHSFDSVSPLVTQPEERALYVIQPFGPSADEAVPMLGPLRHQPGSLKHGNVALHGGECHRVHVGELRDGVLAVQRAGHDVTPGRIAQRTQLPIELL